MKQSQAIAQLQAIRDQNTKIASYLQVRRSFFPQIPPGPLTPTLPLDRPK